MSGDDLLLRAARGLRERTAPVSREDEAGLGAVVSTVRRARKRRRLIAALSVQFLFAGVGVGAWAAATGRLAVIAERLGFSAAAEPGPPRAATPRPARMRPAAPTAELPPVAAPEPVPPSVAAPAAEPPRVAATEPSPPMAAPAPARPSPRPRTQPKLAPSGPTSDELYQAAHEAHFVRKDYAAAVVAWDRYLAAGLGRLTVEARYNRALALLRLGRRQEAAAALRPFADGDYGSYRREEARELLRVFDPPAP